MEKIMAEITKDVVEKIHTNREMILELKTFQEKVLAPQLNLLANNQTEIRKILTGNGDEGLSDKVRRHDRELKNSIERRRDENRFVQEKKKMVRERVYYVIGAIVLIVFSGFSSLLVQALMKIL